MRTDIIGDLNKDGEIPFKKTRMDKDHFALLISKWADNNDATKMDVEEYAKM